MRAQAPVSFRLLPLYIGALMVAAAAPPDAAPFSGVPTDIVPELVVQAATPGPPWWKVTNGSATMWILGTPPAIPAAVASPHPLRWDTAVVRRRLKGARVFLAPVPLPTPIGDEPPSPFQVNADCSILPPRIRKANSADPTIACYTKGKLISKAKIFVPDIAAPGYRVVDLPESQRAELRSVTALYTRQMFSPTQMPQDRWSIVFAAHQLTEALSVSVGLQGSILPDQLAQAAKSAGVPAKAISADFTVAQKTYLEGPPEVQAACLETVIAQAKAGSAPIVKSLQAWARGDVPNSFAQVGCLQDKTIIYGQIANGTAQAIRSFLNQPGHSVAAVELIPLLMKGGVIEQLKGWGYAVSGPDVDAAP